MRFGIAIAALGLAACGMDGDMMNGERSGAVADHGQAVADLRSAAAQHADAAARALTLEELRNAEVTYRAEVDSNMAMMQGAMDRGNSSGGMCGGRMSSSRMMRDVTREMDEHESRMSGAQTVDEALAEEQRHRTAMDEELGDMDDDHAMMQDMMNMCGGC